MTKPIPARILGSVRERFEAWVPAALRGWPIAALLCAIALTAAIAPKPLVIDDPVYVAYARQIQAHPTDPYGFLLYWYEAPEPAMGIGTVPAVLPYWLAGAMTLLGDAPFAWKLSLLPFALALTGSLGFLLERFAKPIATPVLVTLALSPSVLPGFTLMLDVPAVALGLLGFALCVRACELERAWLAVAAGVVLALAMQTKYSAAVHPALAVAYAAIYRRPREGAIVAVTAAGLFVGWEALLLGLYGKSHFLSGLERLAAFDNLRDLTRENERIPGTSALYWTLSALSLLGGTAPYAGLLALVGLGARSRSVLVAALVAALGFAAIPALPRSPVFEADGFLARLVAYNPEILLFVPLGAALAACVGIALHQRLRASGGGDPRPDRVLAAWLLLETLGFFVISPYPTVRRVIGLGIAATLFGAHAAARRGGDPDARSGVRIASVFGLALATLFYVSDLSDARVRRALIDRVADQLANATVGAPDATIWYSGHWEVQFYGERAGWRPVIANESKLRAGDWLVLPVGVDRPRIAFAPHVEEIAVYAATSPLPWSTIPAYYSGPVPLRRQATAQLIARIYRATADSEPRSAAPAAGAPAR